MLSRIILLCLIVLLAPISNAADNDWSKWRTYENKYFRIHSDAKEKKVLKLLEELESFRLVVNEAIKVKVPKDAAKTNVLLFRKKKDFRKTTSERKVIGFVTAIYNQPIIVMPASERGMSSENVIRHEYVHIVQAFDDKRYPRWWREGLAEILSTVEYHGDIALVGKPNMDRWRYLSRELNYNELISEDYDRSKSRLGGDPYAQFWLLAAYSLVHDDGAYHDELGDHILKFRKSGDALQSFIAAYGRTPKEFAKEAMSNFGKRTYSYKPLLYQIDYDERDLDPLITSVDVDQVDRYMTVLVNRKIENRN